MALALNNGYPRVDVESLLFDLKDILRTSLQVNKAQSAEIVRLGGKPINDLMAAEYEERVHAALGQVDAALDVFESESYEAASTHYEVDVLSWIQNTNRSLGLTFESPEAVPYGANYQQPDAVPMTPGQDVPNDFWNVNSFKWEDEPLSDDGSDNEHSSADRDLDLNLNQETASEHEPHHPVIFPNGLIPDEQIPEIMLDDDSDRSSTPRASSTSNFDDSATLYHPEDSPTVPSYLSHRRRHTLVASKLAALAQAHPSHALSSKLRQIFDDDEEDIHHIIPQTVAPPTPLHRPFGLGHMRTASAPDLRALRGTHDILHEEQEHALLSAF